MSTNGKGRTQLQRRIKLLRKKRRKKIIKTTILSVILVLLIGLGISGFLMYKDAKVVKQQASELKANLETTVSCIKAQDYEGAQNAVDHISNLSQSIQLTMDKPLWKIASAVPFVGKNVTAARELLVIAQDASEQLITPLIANMREYPLSELKTAGGFNVASLLSYVNFAETADPQIEALVAKIDEILPQMDTLIGLIDKDGKFVKYKDMLSGLSEKYNDLTEYLPVFKTVLGNGTDRHYMLVAQNSSELRAAGGFPGSAGTIDIVDGLLKIGDFKAVREVLPDYRPDMVSLMGAEGQLFEEWMVYPLDVGHDPDFATVSEVWKIAYDSYNYKDIDGVISMSPAIIQDVLAMSGEVTLSDGTTINGSNATRVLQHDIYFRYFPSGSTDDTWANAVSDALFAETADLAMDTFESNFSIKAVQNYFDMFSKGAKDRTIMMWMANPEEEQIMIEGGCSGKLNTGANTDVAGVYFSINDSDKMGWFYDLYTDASNATANSDGSYTYDVTVTMNNTITSDEINKASLYILGFHNGAMKGIVSLFAPLGGTISEMSTSNGMDMRETEYQGLQTFYCKDMIIYPETPVVITYKVTTAPGVSEPLTFSKTPTLQNYR